jgi:hypothetical protein
MAAGREKKLSCAASTVGFGGILFYISYLALMHVKYLECNHVNSTIHRNSISNSIRIDETNVRTTDSSLTLSPSLLPEAVTSQSANSDPPERKRHSVSEKPFVRPPLLNPWRDFVFTDVDNVNTTTKTAPYYSSHSCVAAAHNDRRPDHVSRTCQ